MMSTLRNTAKKSKRNILNNKYNFLTNVIMENNLKSMLLKYHELKAALSLHLAKIAFGGEMEKQLPCGLCFGRLRYNGVYCNLKSVIVKNETLMFTVITLDNETQTVPYRELNLNTDEQMELVKVLCSDDVEDEDVNKL